MIVFNHGSPGTGPSTLSTISPSTRETVDPIAELLSQLSGVRSATRHNMDLLNYGNNAIFDSPRPINA